MKRDVSLYLKDMLAAMEAIEQFVEGMDFEEFRNDDKTVSAVIRKFESMGEAARHVPEEVRGRAPDVPWRQMVGLRNKLIHFYFGIKHELIWETIKSRLPQLKKRLRQLLNELNGM